MIKKIIIELNGEEKVLDYNEARELYYNLKEIFETKKEYIPSPAPAHEGIGTGRINPFSPWCGIVA